MMSPDYGGEEYSQPFLVQATAWLQNFKESLLKSAKPSLLEFCLLAESSPLLFTNVVLGDKNRKQLRQEV